MLLKIAGGTVYDPANGIDGVVQDVWIQDGKIVAPPTDPAVRPDKVLDATGLVVMPGGVDMHSHIAGPKVNLARKMRPEDKRKAPVVRRTPLDALRHHRQRAQHVRHRLPVRRPGLHHRLRRRHSAARRTARPRGVPRHPPHRQGLLCPPRQQPLRPAADRRQRTGAAAGLRRLAAAVRQRLRASSSSIPAGSRCGRKAAGNIHEPRRRPSSISASRRGRSSPVWRRRRWTSACRIRSTSTATTSVCPATGKRPWPPCRRSKAGGRI